jgi:hypothetical protein
MKQLLRRIDENKGRRFVRSFENIEARDFGHLKQSPLDFVIPAWSAGIQVDMDVPEASLRTWLPAIHAGMTKFAF